MAEKNPTPPVPPAPTPAPVPVVTPQANSNPSFEFEDAVAFAKPVKAASGAGKGVVTETTKKLAAIPAGKTFLVAVPVPDTITDTEERNKYFKTEAAKELSRVKGAARRLRTNVKDTSHAAKNFTIETVSSPELGYGVRVWRDEDTAAA